MVREAARWACRPTVIAAIRRPSSDGWSASTRWKNSNADPPLVQRLVQRGEDDVTHAGGHLPEDRALVVEQGLAPEEHGGSGTERRWRGIAPDKTEHHVVDGADDRVVDELRRTAVPTEPVQVLLVVDGPESAGVGQQSVTDDPPDRRDGQGHAVPGPPQGVVLSSRRHRRERPNPPCGPADRTASAPDGRHPHRHAGGEGPGPRAVGGTSLRRRRTSRSSGR